MENMEVRSEAPGVSLRHAQGVVFTDKSRFRMLIAGRRFGKTYYAAIELVVAATQKPGNYWYLAPTYRMAKDLAWKNLKNIIPPQWITKKNESDLQLELINGSMVELKGSDYADALRGRSLTGVVLDEAAMMGPEVWSEVIRPALADQQGWALFITTPKGTSSWFYDLYLLAKGDPSAVIDAQTAAMAKGWSVHEFTTIEGGNVPPEEIEAARAELDPRTFRQEFEASFENLSGMVCVSFSQANVKLVTDDPRRTLLVGLDFNSSPLVAVCAVRADFHSYSNLHVFAEIVLDGGATTWEMGEELYKRFGMDRPIEICPDPTGHRVQTSGVGLTDHHILRRQGFRVISPKAPWKVKDKINAINCGFQTADGKHHVYISPHCKQLIKSLRSWTYQENSNTPDKKLGNDHLPDALGYLLLSRFNKAKSYTVGSTSYRVW